MENIKKKYSRYGMSEWTTLVFGIIIAIIQVVRYTLNLLGDPTIEIVVLIVWILLIIAPLTLANLIRKARGIETK